MVAAAMYPSEAYPYVVAGSVFFAALLASAFLRWISRTIVHPFAVAIYNENKKKNPSEEFGPSHTIGAWVGLLILTGIFGAGIIGALKPDSASSSSDAERLAKGYFGMQVINCYQMSDFELIANETKCKDALKRVRGY